MLFDKFVHFRKNWINYLLFDWTIVRRMGRASINRFILIEKLFFFSLRYKTSALLFSTNRPIACVTDRFACFFFSLIYSTFIFTLSTVWIAIFQRFATVRRIKLSSICQFEFFFRNTYYEKRKKNSKSSQFGENGKFLEKKNRRKNWNIWKLFDHLLFV